MKLLKLLLIMISLGLITYSCQKETFDELNKIETNQVTSNLVTRSVTDCGFIPELCSKPWIPVSNHKPIMFGPSTDSLIGEDNPPQYLKIVNGNETFTVYTLNLFEESEDFIVIDESDNLFFLLKTQNPYLRRHDKSVTLPKGINIVADLDYSKFINNGISVSDIQSSIGNKVSTTVTNGIITLDISTVDDNDVQALVRYNWCTYVIPSTIMKYKKELMSTYDVTGTDWALDIAIEESVLECTPNLCLDCADSECVINKLINHPQISGSSAIVRDIKINYLRLLLDLSDEQIEWLKDNPSILEDLFNTYELNFNGKDGSSTRSIGCDMNICGAEGAANAHINLLMNDIQINEEEAGNLCDFYTELYNSNKGSYNCLVGEGDLVAQMSIAEFGSTAPIYTILNESGIENSCQPFGKYVPCSEVVFSNPQPPTNKRICQIEIKMALNTLLCIPPVSESEGILQNLDMSLKVEFRIPDFAFSGMFGYENNQTIVATLLSDAVQYVWNLVEADISCSNAVSKKGDFINYFFDFIKDSDVLTQSYYWGQTGFSVEVLENFQIFVPDYENSSTELYWDRSVIKCN